MPVLPDSFWTNFRTWDLSIKKNCMPILFKMAEWDTDNYVILGGHIFGRNLLKFLRDFVLNYHLLLGLKTIYEHLDWLICNLFVDMKLLTQLRSSLDFSNNAESVLPEIKILVSSVNNMNSPFLEQLIMSFMYMINSVPESCLKSIPQLIRQLHLWNCTKRQWGCLFDAIAIYFICALNSSFKI